MKAGNPEVTRRTQEQVRHLQGTGWYHSMDWPSGEVTEGHQSLEVQRERLARFPIPADLSGKSVLDIGAWDGWFGFELERRGATLSAIDVVENPRYLAARRRMGSNSDYRTLDICDPKVLELGSFDIVLFLGVLYHVKHPLLALEHVCALTRDLACVESYVIDHGDLDAKPSMEFYEGEELCGQFDNWVGLNCSCLMAMARTAGFARVDLLDVTDQRGHFSARRRLELTESRTADLRIVACENAITHGGIFAGQGDEYLSVLFEAPNAFGSRQDLVLRFEDFDCVAATLSPKGANVWLANFRFPPGQSRTASAVRLCWAGIVSHNSIDIVVGAERQPKALSNEPLEIVIVTDGSSWERGLVRLGPNACLSIWARGVNPEWIDQILVELQGLLLPPSYISRPDPEGLSQLNFMIPAGMPAGTFPITLIVQDRRSEAKPLNLHNP